MSSIHHLQGVHGDHPSRPCARRDSAPSATSAATAVRPKPLHPRLFWLYTGSATGNLDAATWLEPTFELRVLGWQVTLVAEGSGDQIQVRGIDVRTLRRPRLWLIGQAVFHLRALALLASQWRDTDVVLFHSMSAPWMLTLRLAGLLGLRRPLLVMDTRSLPMADPSHERARDRLRRRYHLWMEHLANGLADGRLAITERMAEAVRIPPRKLWGTWPSGVAPEPIREAAGRRRWPTATETPDAATGEAVELLYIGTLSHERNLMTLCRAVEDADLAGCRYRLTLIGEGPQRRELERYAAASRGRIRVLPQIPHERIPDVLARAHVGVLPFPDEEKFRVSSPIKLFEYMASGLPVLATRIQCHTDVIGRGEHVVWAYGSSQKALADALARLWERRGQLPRMGERSAQAVGAWTWRASARKLSEALIAGVTQHRRRPDGWDLAH